MIFNVEKRKKRQGAKILGSRSYYLRYRFGEMPADKWVSLKTSDKVVANAKAEKFRSQKELELAGLALPPLQIKARKAPIRELIADYIGEMTSQRRDGRYVKGTKAQLERLTGEARWRTLADVTSDSFLSWRRANEVSWISGPPPTRIHVHEPEATQALHRRVQDPGRRAA